jgi:hypothetical protein
MLATASFLLAKDDLTDELLALFAFCVFFSFYDFSSHFPGLNAFASSHQHLGHLFGRHYTIMKYATRLYF